MAYTIPQICNLALAKVGDEGSQITSLDDDTKEANLCKKFFEPSLRELLDIHTWGCATARAELARNTTDPVFGWEVAYTLPADCVRPLEFRDYSDASVFYDYRSEWVIEGRSLLTNATTGYLVYVKYIDDPNLMTATFIRALYTMLASKLAFPLTEDATLVRLFEDEIATVILPEARRVDAFTGYEMPSVDSEWIEASYSSSSLGSNSLPSFSQSSYGTLPY